MKVVRTLELCREGVWGQDGAAITKKDIAEVVETFQGRRPAVIGHPESDTAPKFGDVISVKATDDGSMMYGDVILDETADRLYTDGKYSGWSVSIPKRAADGKRYLHHLAFLGAVPPKIPGLRELGTVRLEFSDGEKTDGAFVFSGKITEEVSGMTEEEKKRMADLEAENKKLKEDAEKEKAAMAEKARKEAEAAAKEKKGGGKEDFSDEAKKAEFADMQKKLEAMEKSSRKARLDAFADKVGDRIPAGVKDVVTKLAERLASSSDFSDAEGADSDSLAMFSDIMGKWPVPEKRLVSEFSDLGQKGGGKDGQGDGWASVLKKF